MPAIVYRVLGGNVQRPPAAGEKYKRTSADVELMLTGLVDAISFHALILLEVSRYHAVLRRLANYAARIFPDRAKGDNAILVRSGIPAGPGYAIEHGSLAWWLTTRGSKTWGRAHVTVKLPGLRLVGVHTPPSVNWINKLPVGPKLRIRVFKAMMTSLDREIAKWIRDEPDQGLLIFGDWNEPPGSQGAGSPRSVAEKHDLEIFPGHGIDWSMGRNVDVETRVIPVGREGNTSDHPLLDLTVTVTAPVVATPTPAPAPTPTPVPVPTPAPTPPQEAPVARQARSLDVLLREVNAAAPKRSKISDGGLGDPAHAARVSDHNPNRAGVWRARDFTDDPGDGMPARRLALQLADLLGKHPALGPGAYVIWDWRIISTDRIREGWRRYTGTNGHTKHVHISVGTAATSYDSTKPWGVLKPEKVWKPGQRDLSYRPADVMHGADVEFVQRKVGGFADGYYGPVTDKLVEAFERRHNTKLDLAKKQGTKPPVGPRLKVDGVVGTGTWKAFGIDPTYDPKG